MKDRDLLAAGVGAVVAAVCCAAPVAVAAAGAVGLTAWLGEVVVPAVILGIALIGFGLYHRQRRER